MSSLNQVILLIFYRINRLLPVMEEIRRFAPVRGGGLPVGEGAAGTAVEHPDRDIAMEAPPEGIPDVEIVVDPADCG